MVMDGGATASRIMGEQEAEMREQMVAAARVMTTLAGGSVLNIGQAMADFVGTPPNPLRSAAWNAVMQLANDLGGDRDRSPNGALADSGRVVLNALENGVGPDGKPLNELNSNMVSGAIGYANIASGGGYLPTAAGPVAGVHDHHFGPRPDVRGVVDPVANLDLQRPLPAHGQRGPTLTPEEQALLREMRGAIEVRRVVNLFRGNADDVAIRQQVAAQNPEILPALPRNTAGPEMA